MWTLAGVDANQGLLLVAAATLVVTVFVTAQKMSKDKHRDKAKAAADADIVAHRDKTALEHLETQMGTLVDVVKGKAPTWDNPHPPPGMLDVVNGLVVTVGQHTGVLDHLAEALVSVAPNGGSTNSTGDLILRVADALGVKNKDPDEDSH